MKEKIKALKEQVLEAGEVPEPEVTTVQMQVRTDAAIPPPHWLHRAMEDQDEEPPAS